MEWMFIFLSAVMAIFGFYLLGIGFLGLSRKRPLVFSARSWMWFLFLALLPNLVNSFRMFFDRRERLDLFLTIMPFLNLVTLIVVVYVFWRQMTGYMIFGVSDETFRDALTSTLNKLNLRFEETISKIRLIDINADLQAAVAGWMGTAQIRIKQYEHAHFSKKIADGMNEYYAGTSVKVNNLVFIVYTILGIVMLIMAVVFALTFRY